MKIHKRLGKFWFDLGWFLGEEFVLFGLDIFRVIEVYNAPKVESVVFLSVQIAHGMFTCGVDLI